MRPDLDDLLCQRYPRIFGDRHGDKTETSMCWGFCCGDGWFEIIDELCAEISTQVNAGKMPIVVARQVKEKIGSLRFYIRGGNDESRRLIELAREKSVLVCDECGLPKQVIPATPWQTLCMACAAKGERKEIPEDDLK